MTREFVKHAILTVDIFVTSGDKSTNMLLFVLFCFCFCVFFFCTFKKSSFTTLKEFWDILSPRKSAVSTIISCLLLVQNGGPNTVAQADLPI